MFQLKPKTLYNWYRNIISDYHQDKQTGKFAGHQVYDYDTQTDEIRKEQVVPIFQPQNMGKSMSIDEKMIAGKYSTIISNPETGKIALLIESVKPIVLQQAIELFTEQARHQVQYISSDMSPMYKKICRSMFPNAKIIIDKFHVIKHIIDALNTVRLNIKSQVKRNKQVTTTNPNGWTDIEFLEKTKYLLYKRRGILDAEENALLTQLLQQYPDLDKSYHLAEEIRTWYDSKHIGKYLYNRHFHLKHWIEKVKASGLNAFNFIVKMFVNHWDDILNYFIKGHTNAKAENLNGRIQRFLMSNYGTRDKDFFFYRTQIYFT